MVLTIAAVAVALWFASLIPKTITVFVIAAFVAFGVNPIVEWLSRRMPRGAAIALVFLGLLLTIAVILLLVVPALAAQVQILVINAPSYVLAIQSWLDSLEAMLRERFGRNSVQPGYDMRTLLATKLGSLFNSSLASATQILTEFVTAAFIGISALVLSAFFLLRGEHVVDGFYEILPARRRPSARHLAGELAHVFGAFVSGQAALCAITGALIFALCQLFLGFKFSLLLGIVAGLAYAVPYVGQVFVHLLAIALAAPQGGAMMLWVSVIVFSVARVSDNLLVPRIMSRSVGVSPIAVMFAVFAGGELFGIPGLLLGIPAAALAKVAWRFYRSGGTHVAEPDDEAAVMPPAPSPRVPKRREA
ncbi:MAG: AI-2E family transporter [Candidatus Eremiobacteraeota bacterium]|nr:AI-2E family transporter [Candidatus Eremiobacteraeota bacterium]